MKARGWVSEAQKEEIRRLLENWVKWRNSGTVGPKGLEGMPYPAYRLLALASTWGDSNNLVINGQGEDTDRILRKMDDGTRIGREQVKALKVHFLYRGTYHYKARLCRLKVQTYYRRVERASVVFLNLCYSRPAQPQPLVDTVGI